VIPTGVVGEIKECEELGGLVCNPNKYRVFLILSCDIALELSCVVYHTVHIVSIFIFTH
jgi:hypothetical protein